MTLDRLPPSGATTSRWVPLVILAPPRSGSHLLAALLENAFGVVTPLETHFIPTLYRRGGLWEPLAEARQRRALLADLFLFTRAVLHQFRAPTADLIGQSILATKARTEDIVARSDSLATVVEEVFVEFARLHGTNRYAEKSAYFFPPPVGAIAAVLKDARVIHLIRDGRAVARSWTETWFGPHNLKNAGILWASHVGAYRSWGRDNPHAYLEVRFEDLLRDQAGALAAMAQFLGVPVLQSGVSLSASGLARAMRGAATHTKLGGSPDAGAADAWRTMDAERIRDLEALIGPELEELGYERLSRAAPPPPRAVTALLAERLRPLAWARGARDHLLVALGARRRAMQALTGS